VDRQGLAGDNEVKIIYITDIHGATWKYEKALKAAKKLNCKAIVNGADMFPKSDAADQDAFINDFLDDHFAKCERAGIAHLGMPGNDDFAVLDGTFAKVCSMHGNVFDISQRLVKLDEHEFVGFNWVVDYPFRLKDRCRMDDKDYVFGRQFGRGLLSSISGDPPAFGWENIPDWPEHARKLPTIEDELGRLPAPEDPSKAIYVIHMPPSGLGLDICATGECVGSKAVRRFLEKTQPAFSLHGHIHESSEMVGGRWKSPLGKTTCIQPGQLADACYVVIDLDTKESERVLS
jgi:Icc-related predicted phosphoesterase